VWFNVQGRLGFGRINLEDVVLLILAESRMEMLRLMIIVYLLRNHLGVRYESIHPGTPVTYGGH